MSEPKRSGRSATADGPTFDDDALPDGDDAATTDDTGDSTGAGTAGAPAASATTVSVPKQSVWTKLYQGETNIGFVGRRRVWFALSAVLVLVGVVGFVVRGGFNLGIEFEGGVVWEVPAGEATVAEAREAVEPFGLAGATIQQLEGDDGRAIRVQAEPVDPATTDEVTTTLSELTGASFDDVNLSEVGPSWGQEVSEKAVRALVVFLVLVTVYITFRFQWKMALATLVALLHDILITAGFYAVTQIEITPATVIALLTILGYSIYDGVVVFDKVDENTRLVSSSSGLSYGGMVDVSLNQALMRSLNTNITALLPVATLLVVGAWGLGAVVIEQFAIALFVGIAIGAYSSIFIASTLLAWLKEREPRYRDIKQRIDAKGGDAEVVAATVAAAGGPVTRTATRPVDTAGSARQPVAPSGRTIPPRPRKKGKGGRR